MRIIDLDENRGKSVLYLLKDEIMEVTNYSKGHFKLQVEIRERYDDDGRVMYIYI